MIDKLDLPIERPGVSLKYSLACTKLLVHPQWLSGCGMSFAVPQIGSLNISSHQRPPLLSTPTRGRCQGRQITPRAAKGAPDPPDTPKQERRGGREWMQTMLSRFGPIAEKAENTAVLDFEKPLVELDNRIKEVMHSSQILKQTIWSLSSEPLWRHGRRPCTQ